MLKEDWEWRKQELRAEIDEVDTKFIRLLAKRMRLCGEVGRIKAKEGSDVYAFKAVGLKIPPRLLCEVSNIPESVVVRL